MSQPVQVKDSSCIQKIKNTFLSRNWSNIIPESLLIGLIPKLEECELLPDEIDGSVRNCLALGVELQNIDKEDNCFWDQGHMYRGIQDVSMSGKKCLRWAHQFHVSLSDNPELTGHNYCR